MYYNYTEVKALSIEIAKHKEWTYTITIPVHYKNLEKEGTKITHLITQNNEVESAFIITQKKRDQQWVHILVQTDYNFGVKECYQLFNNCDYVVIPKVISKKYFLIKGLIKIHCSYGGYHQYID